MRALGALLCILLVMCLGAGFVLAAAALINWNWPLAMATIILLTMCMEHP